MSNKAFQQNLDDKKGPQPGGPYLIQMLFKEPVEMPDKEKMTAIMEKHIWLTAFLKLLHGSEDDAVSLTVCKQLFQVGSALSVLRRLA